MNVRGRAEREGPVLAHADADAGRLRREASFLLVVDVQERLAPAVVEHERVIRRCGALVDAARLLGVPVFASEHCPEGIGATVGEIAFRLAPGETLRKTHFSCADEPALWSQLAALGRPQALVCGMEAHVCVMQTALGLVARGVEVFVAGDACGARRESDLAAALARMAQAGLRAATAEMAMFEWMHRADAPEFRALLRIVKTL